MTIEQPASPESSTETNGLSGRELDVLHLVASGASNKEIARQLSISQNTVKVHLRNIFAKTGATSRTEAAMYAVRMGLVSPAGELGEVDQTYQAGSPGSEGSAALGEEQTFPTWVLANRWLLGVLLGVLGLFGALGVYGWFFRPSPLPASVNATQPTAAPRWQAHQPLPTPRQGLGVVAFENQIIALGGEDEDGILATVEVYDPSADRWEGRAAKPTPVTDIQAVVIGGRVYVPGGRLGSGLVADVLEIYDPRQDQWELGAPLPEPRSAYALTAFEGGLYLFGGWDGESFVDTVYRYDPQEDAWEALPSLPTARGYATAAPAAGAIYVVGGTDGATPLMVNEEFSPGRQDPWQPRAPLPEGRYGMAMVSVADILHLVGGEGAEGAALPPLKYLPQDDLWEPFEMPFQGNWSHLGMASLETNLYVIGGLRQGRASGENLAYKAIYTTIFIPVFREP